MACHTTHNDMCVCNLQSSCTARQVRQSRHQSHMYVCIVHLQKGKANFFFSPRKQTNYSFHSTIWVWSSTRPGIERTHILQNVLANISPSFSIKWQCQFLLSFLLSSSWLAKVEVQNASVPLPAVIGDRSKHHTWWWWPWVSHWLGTVLVKSKLLQRHEARLAAMEPWQKKGEEEGWSKASEMKYKLVEKQHWNVHGFCEELWWSRHVNQC